MKAKIIGIAIVLMMFGMLVPTISAVEITNEVKGAWGLGTDTEPMGRFNGKIYNGQYFVGWGYKSGNGHRVVLSLNDGSYNGYVRVSGINVPISGDYTITNGWVTATWSGAGYNGWIVGKLVG